MPEDVKTVKSNQIIFSVQSADVRAVLWAYYETLLSIAFIRESFFLSLF